MTPGHIPIVTNGTIPWSNEARLLAWRIRTAIYGGSDAADLFKPEQFTPAEARLILKTVGAWSAVVILTMAFIGVLL